MTEQPIVIEPGQERVVWRGDGSMAEQALAVWTRQDESPDDGGSQCGLGLLSFSGEDGVVVEFDIRDGAVIGLPRAAARLIVRNVNEEHDPDLQVWAAPIAGRSGRAATRSFDIGFAMDDPNIRVPAFARTVFFDHGLPDQLGYRALLSDSATGETYGLVAPYTTRLLDRRARFVRFMGLPEESLGTVTFELAL